MAEQREQLGASWEDLPLPYQYPVPHGEDKARLNGVKEQGPSAATTEENGNGQTAKCSPNLLQMLKAAESRRPSQDRDRDGSESVAEAQRTDMVSEDTEVIVHNECICQHAPQEA